MSAVAVRYDPGADVLYLKRGGAAVADSRDDGHRLVVNYDASGAAVGAQILCASEMAALWVSRPYVYDAELPADIVDAFGRWACEAHAARRPLGALASRGRPFAFAMFVGPGFFVWALNAVVGRYDCGGPALLDVGRILATDHAARLCRAMPVTHDPDVLRARLARYFDTVPRLACVAVSGSPWGEPRLIFYLDIDVDADSLDATFDASEEALRLMGRVARVLGIRVQVLGDYTLGPSPHERVIYTRDTTHPCWGRWDIAQREWAAAVYARASGRRE